MGYLIGDSVIIRRRIVIPQADVQIMDLSAPYTLVTTNNSFYPIPIFCNLTAAANQTTPYDGFVHIHLTNTGNYTVGDLCATYAENATSSGDIAFGTRASMLMNLQVSPVRYGGTNQFKNLEIFWENLPTAGDGDLIVDLGFIITAI